MGKKAAERDVKAGEYMSENTMKSYQSISYHPDHLQNLDTVGSVLHSICAIKSCTWKDAYESLIEASSRLGLMPQDRKTIRNMLGEQGFFLQAGAYANRGISGIIAECNELFHNGEAVILNTSSSVTYGKYIPLVPVKQGECVRYVLRYPMDLRHLSATEVWIAWKDGQDHSMMPRRKNTRTASTRANRTEDNEALHVYNENPYDNLIGDCAVRAVAGVLDIPWEEAVRRLAAAQNYSVTVINQVSNIEAFLRKEGFQEFDAIKRNGRILTGKEFCDIIHDMFQAGTRIFAYVGSSHVVAILVFDEDYKIVDTWDSTNRKITKYWAKYPERPPRRSKPMVNDKLTALSLGTKLQHKVYGTGEVTDLTDIIATIRFQDNVEKKLAIAWVLANCKPC